MIRVVPRRENVAQRDPINWRLDFFRAAASGIPNRAAVCHSSPFFRQSPFRRFRQIIQPGFDVVAFDEIVEMEIV
jgi:hypothetical protein